MTLPTNKGEIFAPGEHRRAERLTVAEGELRVALDQIARLVDIVRRADPAWCECHDEEQVDDEEWDEVLAEAEEYLEERR